MSLAEYLKVSLASFGGMWNRIDPAKVPLSQASLAINCEFAPGEVRTRKGFGPVAIPYVIRAMYNWNSSLGNFVVSFGNNGSSVDTLEILITTLDPFNPPSTVANGGVTGIGGVFTTGGAYMFFAPFTATMVGADHGQVILGAGAMDKAFRPPLTSKPTLGVTGSGGVVTAGIHRVGYLLQTRSGFTGRISPVDSGTQEFDTTSTVTVAAGDKISFSRNLSWPLDAVLIYPVMTTVDNLDRYFIVPGMAPAAVVGGVSSTVTFTIDISDADLASAGTNVTDNNLLLTQTTGGTAPFFPFSVANYGNRTVWLTEIANVSQAYFSEPDQPQVITADQHVRYLPGNRQMRAQGSAGRTHYILGPHWTYAFEDTGEVPVLWPSPRLVDGSIGTLSPHGFTVDSSTGIGWCAHLSGLYHFSGGSFAPLPVSYYSSNDWRKVNWPTAAIPLATMPRHNPPVVIDDKTRLRVIVMAGMDISSTVTTSGAAVTITDGDEFPLAGVVNAGVVATKVTINGVEYTLNSITDGLHGVLNSTAGSQTGVKMTMSPPYPTHLLVYDYSSGLDPDKIKYSRWQIRSFIPGGMCIVQNPTNELTELWLGEWYDQTGSGNLNVMRQMGTIYDTTPYNDNSLNIQWYWESAKMPEVGADLGAIYHHYAQQIRATGNGSLSRTLYGLDGTKSQALTAITLGAEPGRMYMTRFPRMRSEAASVRFGMTSTANTFCVLSGLEHFYGLGPRFR